mmetsp:Transcript_38421/g.65936  ORF Transcript_38421/g.65936 Transcript_38421/m.65936 type:complete len:278 (-) Transcript_38421:452-1285(-)
MLRPTMRWCLPREMPSRRDSPADNDQAVPSAASSRMSFPRLPWGERINRRIGLSVESWGRMDGTLSPAVLSVVRFKGVASSPSRVNGVNSFSSRSAARTCAAFCGCPSTSSEFTMCGLGAGISRLKSFSQSRFAKNACAFTASTSPPPPPSRPAGERSSSALMNPEASGETVGGIVNSHRMICCTRMAISALLKGDLPTSISKIRQPSVHQSTDWSYGAPCSTSGAIYSGVPQIVPVVLFAVPVTRFDMPKSVSFRCPSMPTMTFSGFRSRYITEWA